ncbi:MAG: NUDIX domain-containing protein [Anaerolineae bacterium]|nr:NUDIX domain-containing protein [Anaerolineae bacterium]NIN96605.1 NUDIX domain-containing protein [Anaerolineae bacterium]NIQ79638.1 NUDIX domain-containing protein [Anaerolineae bacterium]
MSHRLYPGRPIVGVGVLMEEDGRYLLVKRAAEPDAGLWSIPGGLIEVGEKAADAAAREALEETGLTVEILNRVDVVDRIVRDPEGDVMYHFIIIDFHARPLSGEMRPMDDALDAVWVTPEEFTEYELTPTLVELLKRMGLYPEL